MFRSAPHLMEIYLDGNQIRSLHDATFSELPLLEVINLSQNKLPALPSRLLERVSSSGLKTFDLENNSISLMPDGFFSSKPELPYVYLSHNPWLCSCAVGYLHSYLNDQEHNVYVHDGPNDILPGADSVVCSAPPHLFQRRIIELEENDFCPPDPPLYPSGDQDFPTPTIRISVKPDTTTVAHLPASNKTWTAAGSWVTESWTEKWSHFWNVSEFILNPVTFPRLDIPTKSLANTQPTTSESPTTGPSTARSQSQSTGPLDPHASTTIKMKTKTSTVGLITAGSQSQSTTRPESHTRITVQTEPPTAERTTALIGLSTSVGPRRAEALDGRMLPWCWWLFAGFVLLCVLSALTSSFLFLWLLRNYLTVYQRLKRHRSARLDRDGVILRAYRCTENTRTRENEGESVSFLALQQIKDVQAVFRSVLFINQREEQYEETKGKAVSSKIEVVSEVDEGSDKEREPMMSGEVFRKTLYRVISREEEADGWRQEEERWVQSAEGTTARYSLILREDRGPQLETQWVVGEWKMGDGGVAYQRSCSLIGQPSTIGLE